MTFAAAVLVGSLTVTRFADPPAEHRPECWWWFPSSMNERGITHDLEAMKRVGLAGFYFYGGDRSTDAGVGQCRYALREAHRLGLTAGIVIGSAGCDSPRTRDENLRKELVFSRADGRSDGSGALSLALPRPEGLAYRDIVVLAVPDMADAGTGVVVNVTRSFDAGTGRLDWVAPSAGKWTALRFGFVSRVGGKYAKNGRFIDHMSRAAFDAHWESEMMPLLRAVTSDEKSVLRAVLCDSWEAGDCSWTLGFEDEFRTRRGYDLLPWLPVKAGLTIADRRATERFLRDFDLTVSDLITENHYAYKKEVANRHGLLAVTEAAGPHQRLGDARRMQGRADVAMGEFWSVSAHRPGPGQRFMLRDAAMAAHVYGIRTVEAESFTQVRTHWTMCPRLLKLAADRAFCEGLNRVCYHGFDGKVAEKPHCGYTAQWAGIHYDPQSTWFELSRPFNDYLTRCSWMLSRGRPVADCLLYAGDGKGLLYGMKSPEDGLGFGYDYDVAPTEILLHARVEDGEIVLPSGACYKTLFVSDRNPDSSAEMGAGGVRVPGVYGPVVPFLPPEAQDKLAALEREGATVLRTREMLQRFVKSGALAPDFIPWGLTAEWVDWIHRTTEDGEIYFIANRLEKPLSFVADFRQEEGPVAFWDAVSGRCRRADAEHANGRTRVPVSLPAGGSVFVVFGAAAGGAQPKVEMAPAVTIDGPWTLQFDAAAGGPAEPVVLKDLLDWTSSSEKGVRYYSGTVCYRTTFTLGATGADASVLDLGDLADLAEVILNGRRLGIAWTPPYRLPVGTALRDGKNELEVRVTNRWFNRFLLDESLPEAKRVTHASLKPGPDGRVVTQPTDEPFKSGLFGPVRLLGEVRR